MKRVVIVLSVGLALGGLVVAIWLSDQDPDEVSAWRAAPLESPRPVPVLRPSPPQAIPPAPPTQVTKRECRAMTWGVRGQRGLTTWVGAIDGSTDAFHKDTPCSQTRPLLCFQPGARARPASFSFPELTAQIGWTGGAIALVPEVLGLEVRSRSVADRMCAGKFGAGWRMAEFHDGGGWGFGAEGELPRDARFWVAISDQVANLWDREQAEEAIPGGRRTNDATSSAPPPTPLSR